MCAGMEVLNRAIESIMNSTDRDEWEPTVIHVTDNVLSLWKGQVTFERAPRSGSSLFHSNVQRCTLLNCLLII